jgi:XTP/dITP diphosphohydrolase
MNDSSSSSHPSTDKFIIFASFNANKFLEIRNILQPNHIPVRFLQDFPEVPEAPETGSSFAKNAKQKAEFYSRYFHQPLLAEDSGLVIPSLNGYPGIHSARIAADDASRIRVILSRLRELENPAARAVQPPEDLRRAYYVCSLFFLTQSSPYQVEDRCEGTITREPRGNLGFGYDPIFQPDGSSKSFGEMNVSEKETFSHRGKALRKMLPYLQKEWN